MKKIALSFIFLSLVACGQTNNLTTESSTPTQPPIISPIATAQIESTPTLPSTSIAPTETPITKKPFGNIYVWNADPPSYGVIDLDAEPWALKILMPAEPEKAGPDRALTVSFSRFSNQIAYVTSFSEELELWISDANLTQSSVVWADEERRLGSNLDTEQLRIFWEGNDNFVVLESNTDNPHTVIYNLSSGTTTQLTGKCSQIDQSPVSARLALWCPGAGQPPQYTLLESDGIQNTTDVPPSDPIRILEWTFSPNGETVIYANDQDEVALINPDKSIMKLPVKYSQFPWSVPTNFHWSHNGSQVLVYGYSQNGLCPQFYNSEFLQYQERPCWILFDSASGNEIWWPKDDLAQMIDTSWDSINDTVYEASLSPDTQWLASSLRESGIRYFLIASLVDDQVVTIGDFTASKLAWYSNP